MKHIFWTFIIGIIAGIAAQIWLINPYYPGKPNPVHDTVYVDSIVKNDSIITQVPHSIITSLDSVTIDTINTVVNGKVVDAKYKITLK